MKSLSFEVKFNTKYTHWVSVILHSSRTVMRRELRRKKHDSTHTNACCWQANNPTKDGCVAEIHFARDFLTLETIAHEATHAAWHHTVLLGISKEDDDFQEWVAKETGILTDAIVAFLDSKRVPIRYELVNRRMI